MFGLQVGELKSALAVEDVNAKTIPACASASAATNRHFFTLNRLTCFTSTPPPPSILITFECTISFARALIPRLSPPTNLNNQHSLHPANMAEIATNGPTPAPTNDSVPLNSIPVSPPNGGVKDVTNGSDKFEDGEKIVTVFDDPANFNVKHQLQHKWTLWFTKPPSGKQDWNELLKEVISFDSVEEFWGIYVGLSYFLIRVYG
jgi:hypothetical protein